MKASYVHPSPHSQTRRALNKGHSSTWGAERAPHNHCDHRRSSSTPFLPHHVPGHPSGGGCAGHPHVCSPWPGPRVHISSEEGQQRKVPDTCKRAALLLKQCWHCPSIIPRRQLSSWHEAGGFCTEDVIHSLGPFCHHHHLLSDFW